MNETTIRGKLMKVRYGPEPECRGELRIDKETLIGFSLYGNKSRQFFHMCESRIKLMPNPEIILIGELQGTPLEIKVDSWIVP